MKRWLGSVVLWLAIFGIGAVSGPVLIAGVNVLHDDDGGIYDESEATKLIAAYQYRMPPRRIFLSLAPPDEGKACGYEPTELFPNGIMEMANARSDDQFSDYEGYYALEEWASDLKDKAWLAEIAWEIERSMPRSEIEFLRRCIESTLLSSICMKQVESFGDSVERFPAERRELLFAASGNEQEVICSYLDGVAVRRGIPLVNRKD